MAWLANGDAACDNRPTCPRTYPATSKREQTIQRLRAVGWHYWQGETHGGRSVEAMLCRECARGERRTTRTKPTIEDTPIPEMEQLFDV